jgi:folate-binding protein YgfZ
MFLLREYAFSEVSSEHQTLLRIKAGIPNYPFELNEQALFSEASLSTAVSFKKGCYVGQEVVEKVAALGRLPKKLFRLRAKGAIQLSSTEAEASVYDLEGAPIGKLTSYAYESDTDTTFAFATLKNLTHLVAGTKVKVSDLWGEVI